MMKSNAQNQKTSRLKAFLRKAAKYFLGYLLYTVCMAALVFLLFRIDMDLTLILTALGDSKFQVRGITNWTVVIMGLLMLVGIGFSEDWLRKSIAENRMWKVLLRMYLATAAAWLLWEGIYFVAIRIIL
jgi:hypothetical protein